MVPASVDRGGGGAVDEMSAGAARTRQIRLPPVQPSAQAEARQSRLWTTRAAAQGFFHDNGVRGMLHDFASELALLRPENPRQFLYAKLQRELAAEEKAKEDNEERAPALDGRTDCLRVHTECRAGGRVRRGYFVQRAPLLSDPRLEPGGIAHAASTRFVSWGTEALAAVKSVVHETAGLQAAGPESSGSARARPQLAMHIRSVCSCMLASIPQSQSIQIHTFEHASTHMHLLHACIHTHAHL